MRRAEQAKLFLAKAAEDESLLDAVFSLTGVSDSIFGFHCQQAAEKLLKALLSHHAVAFSRTHDLSELMELLETAGHQLPDDILTIDELTPFAVQFRYDEFSAVRPVDRSSLRELVRNLRHFAESEIRASTE